MCLDKRAKIKEIRLWMHTKEDLNEEMNMQEVLEKTAIENKNTKN